MSFKPCWKVTFETRKIGAIGAWEERAVFVWANSRPEAIGLAQGKMWGRDLETRGVKVERFETAKGAKQC